MKHMQTPCICNQSLGASSRHTGADRVLLTEFYTATEQSNVDLFFLKGKKMFNKTAGDVLFCFGLGHQEDELLGVKGENMGILAISEEF